MKSISFLAVIGLVEIFMTTPPVLAEVPLQSIRPPAPQKPQGGPVQPVNVDLLPGVPVAPQKIDGQDVSQPLSLDKIPENLLPVVGDAQAPMPTKPNSFQPTTILPEMLSPASIQPGLVQPILIAPNNF